MKISEELGNQIVAKLKERVSGGTPICPICQKSNWQLTDQIVSVALGAVETWAQREVTTLPCVGLVCLVCGNTIFLNLLVLGFHEFVKEIEAKGKSDQSSEKEEAAKA